MWTVRNNLKGALKFTDIFIGGKPIILKSKGFLDLDLIDGGRRSAEMSEQLKRCYDEEYIRDIYRTNTPEEVVQMNLRDLESIAQRTELEELKSKLKDGGSKMDEILQAIGQQSNLPDSSEGLNDLKDQLQSVIEQIQNVSINQQDESVSKSDLKNLVSDINKTDQDESKSTEALEKSNAQLKQILENQDQKIEALSKMLQQKNEQAPPTTNNQVEKALEEQAQRLDQLMKKLGPQKQEEEKASTYGFTYKFNNNHKKNEEQNKTKLSDDPIKLQLDQQRQQMEELMSLVKNKDNPVKDYFGATGEEQRQVLKNQLMQQQQMDQLAELLKQKSAQENQKSIEDQNAQKFMEQQLQLQQEQIQQLTSLLTQNNSEPEAPNELKQKIEEQQKQLSELTTLLSNKEKEKPQEQNKDLMEENLKLQQEQLMNISETMKELKEKDDARHEDMVDLKVLMAQHQSGNTFTKVVKTLSATDIEAALKVSDQIDDRIDDKSFEVTKKTKQKVDHPDVSELLGDSDLDFD